MMCVEQCRSKISFVILMLRLCLVSVMGMLAMHMKMRTSRMVLSFVWTTRQMHMRKADALHGKNSDDQDRSE